MSFMFWWHLAGLVGIICGGAGFWIDEPQHRNELLDYKNWDIRGISLFILVIGVSTLLGPVAGIIGLVILVSSFFESKTGKNLLHHKPFGDNK